MLDLSLEHVKACIEKHAKDNHITLIYPGDLRRESVILVMAGAHAVVGSGWNYSHARQNVTVTLPGAGFGLSLIGQIPLIGSLLAEVAKDLVQPTIFFSPTSMQDGISLLATYLHEIGHVGSIRSGGGFWCLAYGLFQSIRVVAEAPCYGASNCVEHAFRGTDPVTLENISVEALGGYGLDEKETKFAKKMIHSTTVSLQRGGDPGGIIREAREILALV